MKTLRRIHSIGGTAKTKKAKRNQAAAVAKRDGVDLRNRPQQRKSWDALASQKVGEAQAPAAEEAAAEEAPAAPAVVAPAAEEAAAEEAPAAPAAAEAEVVAEAAAAPAPAVVAPARARAEAVARRSSNTVSILNAPITEIESTFQIESVPSDDPLELWFSILDPNPAQAPAAPAPAVVAPARARAQRSGGDQTRRHWVRSKPSRFTMRKIY